MRNLLIFLLAFGAWQEEVVCQNEALRRRRIRKKVIKQQPVVNKEAQIVGVEESAQSLPQQVAEEDRNARGFLDEYYAQFENRVSESTVDRSGQTTNARMDAYGTDYESDNQGRDMPNSQNGLPDYAEMYQQMQMEALLRRKQEKLQKAIHQKHLEEDMLEEELNRLPSTIQQNQPELRTATRYVQHVALPNHSPDDKTYMYSSVMPEDPGMNEIMPAKSVASYVYAKPDSMDTAEDTLYTSPYVSQSSNSDDSDISRFFTDSSSGSSGFYGDLPSPSSNTDAVSRFFGLTGTTSQDIQLGLTFTVPFLSVPLTSLQSMLGGGGLGDLFDNFNLDSTSLITIVVIGVSAIFVLPQVIYWLTGVNLSAFNWGRMDEGHGMNIATVMNMIDESLKKYDVDTRSCMARTMCNQYAERMIEGEEEAVQRIGRGIVENIASNDFVRKYLGESKVQEALKYGEKGKDCSIYYSRDVCPWDTSAMIKIASKIMTSGNIDFASIASAAAANLISSQAKK